MGFVFVIAHNTFYHANMKNNIFTVFELGNDVIHAAAAFLLFFLIPVRRYIYTDIILKGVSLVYKCNRKFQY